MPCHARIPACIPLSDDDGKLHQEIILSPDKGQTSLDTRTRTRDARRQLLQPNNMKEMKETSGARERSASTIHNPQSTVPRKEIRSEVRLTVLTSTPPARPRAILIPPTYQTNSAHKKQIPTHMSGRGRGPPGRGGGRGPPARGGGFGPPGGGRGGPRGGRGGGGPPGGGGIGPGGYGSYDGYDNRGDRGGESLVAAEEYSSMPGIVLFCLCLLSLLPLSRQEEKRRGDGPID